jgi:hypothetical protein
MRDYAFLILQSYIIVVIPGLIIFTTVFIEQQYPEWDKSFELKTGICGRISTIALTYNSNCLCGWLLQCIVVAKIFLPQILSGLR